MLKSKDNTQENILMSHQTKSESDSNHSNNETVNNVKVDQKAEQSTSKNIGIGESKEFKIPSRSHFTRPGQTRDNNHKKSFRRNNDRRSRHHGEQEFDEKVVQISRVTKVTKGGRSFSFSVFVVIGNKKGRVGIGHGKAKEVPDAIKDAINNAKKNLVSVPIIDQRTVPHEQSAKFLASKVLIKPAPKGKGIIAGGAVRAVVELAGYKDIYTKSSGSRTKFNTMKATLKALLAIRKPEKIAEARGIPVEDLLK